MEFSAIQQFPLHFLSGLQADSGGQGHGEAHVKPGILSARTDRLDAQRIGDVHFFSPINTVLLGILLGSL